MRSSPRTGGYPQTACPGLLQRQPGPGLHCPAQPAGSCIRGGPGQTLACTSDVHVHPRSMETNCRREQSH